MKPPLRWAIFAVLLGPVFVAETAFLHRLFTTRFPGGNDLLPRWAAAVMLVATVLVSPVVATTEQVILCQVLILLCVRAAPGSAEARMGRRAYILFTLAVTAFGLWWLFGATVVGRHEQPPVYLPLPLGLAGAMLLAGRPQNPEPAP